MFEIPSDATRQFRGRFPLGVYELPERILISRHLPKDSRILELGGCLGIVSCILNEKISDPTQHVVIESNPLMIPYLELNRDSNGCAFSIVSGVVSKKREVTIHADTNTVNASEINSRGGTNK